MEIRDTTKEYLNKAYKKYKAPLRSIIKKPKRKTIKLSFTSGNFYIIKNVLEFVPGYKFLFIAYIPDGGTPISILYERKNLESVSMKDFNGVFKTVKLKKISKLGGYKNFNLR